MKPVCTINLPDIMCTDAARKVMEVLAPDALFVGGCVRNALLGEAVNDIDIATKLHPPEVTKRLESAGVHVFPTGIDHGTVTAVYEGKSFEITTLRRDVATDGRRATIEFAEHWIDDARRRDFTMNTLLADGEGQVYDPLGCGYEDLRARRVVFVGSAHRRIAEDYLRILRFFRFHGAYGSGAPDAVALDACRAAAEHVASLSKERITQEFFKILMFENPVPTLELMGQNNVLSVFVVDLNQLKTLCDVQNRFDCSALAPRLYLYGGLDAHILLTNKIKKHIKLIDKALENLVLQIDHDMRVLVYRYGRDVARDVLMLSHAQEKTPVDFVPRALDIVQNWPIPKFPITGHDLINRGLSGQELGQELSRLEQQWVDRGFI